jgi:hypothetical protein
VLLVPYVRLVLGLAHRNQGGRHLSTWELSLMHPRNRVAARSCLLAIGSPAIASEAPAQMTLIAECYGQAHVAATSRTVELIRLEGIKE